MSGKKKTGAKVLSQRMIAPDIYDMWLETELADEAAAGQFVGVYPVDKSHLLPRPISICEVDRERSALRLVYRIAGAGTGEFASWQPGQEAALLGVLGNGFPVKENAHRKAVLLGGGIGIPPMLELARELKEQGAEVTIVIGYRDDKLFLKEDLERYGRVFVATEDSPTKKLQNTAIIIPANMAYCPNTLSILLITPVRISSIFIIVGNTIPNANIKKNKIQKTFSFLKRIKFADNNLFISLTSHQTDIIALQTFIPFLHGNHFTIFFC